MDLGIAGKVALVTGGARSLGKQDCLTLAAEGCKLIILDLNEKARPRRPTRSSAAAGRARLCRRHHDRAALAEIVRRAEREVGPVDICVNNAGCIYTMGQLKDMADEDWDLNLKINLTGTYNVTKGVFPGMRERKWGRVISWPRSRADRWLRQSGMLDEQDQRGRGPKSVARGARFNVTST